MLLKIDHWANSATPRTANTEERKMEICEYSTPKSENSTIEKNATKDIVTVFEMRFK